MGRTPETNSRIAPMNKRKRAATRRDTLSFGERARVRGTAILDNLEAHPKRPAALHSPPVHGENARNQFAHCTHEQTETGSDARGNHRMGGGQGGRGTGMSDNPGPNENSKMY